MSDLLVPYDNSPSAQRALDHALALASARSGTRLQVLSVLGEVGIDTRELVDAAEIDRVLAAEAAAMIDPARARVASTGIACTYHSASGVPARVIADHARSHGVGEIVMGTRGLGAIPGLLLGSVAQRVLQLADCPVTLVK
ncbi:MAG: universal stress protein [Betaproteobacteria bacterium]|jgi:nucleotide-binding universal stress UspA family protein|nr:universal stress protein [Betaproteobacteria bacterium]